MPLHNSGCCHPRKVKFKEHMETFKNGSLNNPEKEVIKADPEYSNTLKGEVNLTHVELENILATVWHVDEVQLFVIDEKLGQFLFKVKKRRMDEV